MKSIFLKRTKEVKSLIVQGKTNKDIAETIFVSRSYVNKIISSLKAEYKVNSRSKLQAELTAEKFAEYEK